MHRRRFLSSLAALSAATVIPAKILEARESAAPLPHSTSPTAASMWIYLWDLVDEGYAEVLQRLKEHGLTHISLATAYHAGKFLAPHNPKRKVVFLRDGTIYFTPTTALYGKVKPIVNPLVKEGHHLRRVLREAERFGFPTRSWVVCCHNTPLGTRYPDIAVETAFGDRLLHNLCPSNPDVRAYLRAVVADVANHGVEAIELEALQFQGYTHGMHHEREGMNLGPATHLLLGLCFCSSCRQRAQRWGLDLETVREFTRTTLSSFFRDPDAIGDRYPTVEALPEDLFGQLFQWRTNVITGLVEELQNAVPHTRLRPMASLDATYRRLVGSDPSAVAGITNGILALGYLRDGAALRGPLSDLQRQVGSANLTVGFQVGMPGSGGREEFLDRMNTARALGIESYNFYNYGFIPLPRFAWITEALR